MTRLGIGDVTVLAELGAGAGSRVFHVRRREDKKEYALKVVRAGRSVDRIYLEQAKNEFRIGQMLDHPNVAKVHAFELRRDWLFRPTTARLLVEYAPGISLDKSPALAMGCLLRVFERVAAALEHMHGRRVFHADMKPKNLMYHPRSGVKVIDFGLAWVAGEVKNRVQGTPEFMAPETAAGRLINARTDIYNFGATMYTILTRRTLTPPRIGPVLRAHANAVRIKPVESLNPEVPQELCNLVHECLNYEPDQRPQTAAALRAILERLARDWKGE